MGITLSIYIYIVIFISIVKIFLSTPGPQARVERSQPVILALLFGAQCGQPDVGNVLLQ